MRITEDIRYVGVNDHKIDLFEGQYRVPNGMSYNSYVIMDGEIAVMDTVDRVFTDQWLDNLEEALEGREPSYLVVQHMEPDHSASIVSFMKKYPGSYIVASDKAFSMMKNFYGSDFEDRQIVVGEGSSLPLGKHRLGFVTAPMVHWPEVIMTYDSTDKVLFSADAFGKFGALDREEPWLDEARRYYIGIVGKYGVQVKNVLSKAAALDIRTICPLHGPVLDENLGYYLRMYGTWASYEPETDGILIAYTSVYGNTRKAVEILAEKLKANGCRNVVAVDLAREDMSKCIADAFRYRKVVFATTTYNADIFPFMRTFISGLVERGFRNRTVAFIENGSWAAQATKVMKRMLEDSRNLTYCSSTVSLRSAIDETSMKQIEDLAREMTKDYAAQNASTANKSDMTALFKIGYGLYVVTCNDGKKDNGLIVNTVSQVTNSPNRVAVCINKQNYSHSVIRESGKLNVNCLSVEAPFEVFQRFGFQSGRSVDKFADFPVLRSDNGLAFLPKYINAFMSLSVEQYIDLDTHGMFICHVTEARVVSDKETMTYNFYQSDVKPKPKTEGKKGWVCKVCGYVHDGEELPDDFICPLCKHGKDDFERIK